MIKFSFSSRFLPVAGVVACFGGAGTMPALAQELPPPAPPLPRERPATSPRDVPPDALPQPEPQQPVAPSPDAPSGPLPEPIIAPRPQPALPKSRPPASRPAIRLPLVARPKARRLTTKLAGGVLEGSNAARDAGLAAGGSLRGLHLLAGFSTPYDARLRGRTNNLRMAARLVNGTVVPPRATFSANRAIGPRHAAAGWREAKMFVSGQVVSGVGAGICQCSSTIYNAALLAGLPIVERHPHSFRVDYAPPSRDAAIYWGSKDMRFRNDTAGPIYVQTFLRGGRFHARLYGTQPVRERVEVVSRTLSRAGGTRSEAYRIIHTETGALRQRLSRDYYKPRP